MRGTGVAAATVLSLLSVACAPASPGPSFQSDLSTPSPVGGPALTVRQDRLDPTMDSLVVDGEVDEADLEAALLATVSCAEGEGVTATASIDRRVGVVTGYGASIHGGATPEVADGADAAWSDCESRFISPMFDLYNRDHPTPQATLERWQVEDRLNLVECLQGLGFEVDSDMTDEAIEESVDRMAFFTCSG